MKKAIIRLEEYKQELQEYINESKANQKTLRVSIASQEMIGINSAIKVLKE